MTRITTLQDRATIDQLARLGYTDSQIAVEVGWKDAADRAVTEAQVTKNAGNQRDGRFHSIATEGADHGHGTLPGNDAALLAELGQKEAFPVDLLIRHDVDTDVRVVRPTEFPVYAGYRSAGRARRAEQAQTHPGPPNGFEHLA